jgi:hypothetical protein
MLNSKSRRIDMEWIKVEKNNTPPEAIPCFVRFEYYSSIDRKKIHIDYAKAVFLDGEWHEMHNEIYLKDGWVTHYIIIFDPECC